ncbi:hypothetical protein HVE01_06910 [Vreelandella venusta]|nr:hypothetical protein HVE01_06910 [Halomonas venusta]
MQQFMQLTASGGQADLLPEARCQGFRWLVLSEVDIHDVFSFDISVSYQMVYASPGQASSERGNKEDIASNLY